MFSPSFLSRTPEEGEECFEAREVKGSQSEEGLKVCTEEFRRGVGRWGMLAGVGCKSTLIDLANGSFPPQNILHPALSLISWKSHLPRNDLKKQFDFKKQAMITFRVQMQLVSKSLSDADYLSVHLIHHCMSFGSRNTFFNLYLTVLLALLYITSKRFRRQGI